MAVPDYIESLETHLGAHEHKNTMKLDVEASTDPRAIIKAAKKHIWRAEMYGLRTLQGGMGRGGKLLIKHTFRRTALGPQDASTSSPLGGLRIAVVERWRFVALALGFAHEFDAIGIVDDAVEDRVGDRRFADHPWPALYRDLADDHDGLACVALFNDLEQIAAALGGEALQPPVV